jgi:hypothetical protein
MSIDESLYLRGNELFRSGDYEAAEKIYGEGIARWKSSPGDLDMLLRMFLNRAQTRLLLRDYEVRTPASLHKCLTNGCKIGCDRRLQRGPVI